jgi:putative hydrolase of the HAD superfamily
MIKTVIFDIDDTLYSFKETHKIAFAALSTYAERELGIHGEELERESKEIMAELTAYMGDVAAIHNRTIRFQNLLEKRGLPLEPHALAMDEIYWGTLIDASVPTDGALEVMQELKKRGIRIGIGTDMTARMQLRKLSALGLLSYVDFLVSSEEACAEKPSRRFFDRCVEKALCSADACMFVGDSLRKDAKGAADAGLLGIWYHPEEENCKTDAEVPVIRRLPELLKWI